MSFNGVLVSGGGPSSSGAQEVVEGLAGVVGDDIGVVDVLDAAGFSKVGGSGAS